MKIKRAKLILMNVLGTTLKESQTKKIQRNLSYKFKSLF